MVVTKMLPNVRFKAWWSIHNFQTLSPGSLFVPLGTFAPLLHLYKRAEHKRMMGMHEPKPFYFPDDLSFETILLWRCWDIDWLIDSVASLMIHYSVLTNVFIVVPRCRLKSLLLYPWPGTGLTWRPWWTDPQRLGRGLRTAGHLIRSAHAGVRPEGFWLTADWRQSTWKLP